MNPVYLLWIVVAGAAHVQAHAKCGGEEGEEEAVCVPLDSREPEIVDCQLSRAKAVASSILDPTEWIPECDANNKFVKLQRLEYRIEEADGTVKEVNQTFCVDKHGDEYKNSRKDDPEIADCDGYKDADGCSARAALASANNQTYIPACTADDQFQFKQCFGDHGWCWCSQADGNPIPGTFHHEKESLNQPACQMHREYEKTFTSCEGGIGMEKHPFDHARYMWCSPGQIHSCLCPKHLIFDGERCVDPYHMPWYCMIGINNSTGTPGPVLLGERGTRFLDVAQASVNNGSAVTGPQAIVPMVGLDAGLPTTLDKAWGTGSMFWNDQTEVDIMRAACGDFAKHLGILFENIKQGAEIKPHHWMVYFRKEITRYEITY